jgi:RNA polymerase sigma-70 factor (ECF subfamily)
MGSEVTADQQHSGAVASDAALRSLIGRMAAGDQRALEEFYECTVRRAYAVAVRILRQVEAAEEAVEDAYWQAWREADRYDAARGRPLTWLLTICRSRALDALRRLEPAEPREDIESLHASAADPHDDPADLFDNLQRGSAVRAAVETLKPQARQLVALAFFRGMTQQEIADACGLPLGTVKATLFRAYQQLKDCLVSRGFGAGA